MAATTYWYDYEVDEKQGILVRDIGTAGPRPGPAGRARTRRSGTGGTADKTVSRGELTILY